MTLYTQPDFGQIYESEVSQPILMGNFYDSWQQDSNICPVQYKIINDVTMAT